MSSQKPYIVPMDSVKCFLPDRCDLMNDNVDHATELQTIYNVLNGSVVGLCCNNGTSTKNNNKSLLVSSSSSSFLPECIGLGIVRSIDLQQRIFYILTPIPPNQLQRVNILVGGQIQLPTECVFRGVKSETFPFHTCHDMSSSCLGSDIMKSKNMTIRK
uniref:NOL9 C-terminal domain-containing protein n=1 Tax=Eucampia antarctica TaxID=49252 RepID=A0A7S2RSR7_9STRA